MQIPSTKNGNYPNVVVTSLAATTSIAGDVDSTWKGLLNGESGIDVLDDSFVEKFELPVRIGGHLKVKPSESLTRQEAHQMSYVEQMAVVLAREVWRNAGSPEVDKNRLGVAIGTGLGGGEFIAAARDRLQNGGYRKISPLTVQRIMPNGSAACVGLELGARAGVVTPVSACSSGSEAIANAWQMIVMGDADMVVTGGVEGSIQAVPIAAFTMMRAMSTRNEEPRAASRPFDKDRDGFVFGEAGAMMIIETEEHAKARGATIHARLMGAGITSDAFHLVAPDLDGKGAARAMTRAMQKSGITKSDVTHVNAHATATPIGDTAEALAINSAVGDHASVYAPKSALGHSIGAVGALESVLTVLTVRDGIVPPTLNLDNQDPEIELDVVKGQARPGRIDYAVNNSFGFGGHNVAIAFGRY
ncbi:KasA/KasB family beta-ketoacyl-ACP synthase [Nocardia sp. NBC_00565]|uniref:KasA/KasB family beta-ketoacyl-ACP synthase n=1 Tax=Nocardia sp. NBC_00565 TaxID=2975993 RepID=UPI002E8110EB|nr:KasA/KasB family beta-ketoacyl-ACP synthase [Nocardia sp. NBC_00565]WUC01768.1 KasA/KasB family beta-ketoacyl-ACP synthase [Nocardia sp. NBC_00565]